MQELLILGCKFATGQNLGEYWIQDKHKQKQMSTVQHDSRVISQLHRTLHASNFQTFFLPRPESASPAAILALIAARKRMVACGGEGGRSSYR
jgi:hypothetical protein